MTIAIPKAAAPLDGGTVDGGNLGCESAESVAKMSFYQSKEGKDASNALLDSILKNKQ